jgi:hypothetical protein
MADPCMVAALCRRPYHRHHVPDSRPPHIAHKLKSDSEYCPAGIFFRKATDGRQPRLSAHPVRQSQHGSRPRYTIPCAPNLRAEI